MSDDCPDCNPTTDVPLTTAEAAYLYALLNVEGPDEEDAALIEKVKKAL